MFENLIGRLKIQYKASQNRALHFDTKFSDNAFVHEILSEKLKFRGFDGYNNINLTFNELDIIIKKDIKEWKLKLDHMQGVYLLIDDNEGKFYIGSATGESGIWQGWSNYIYNFTGGNKGLDDLHKQVSPEYFNANFRFVLLEYFTDKTDVKYVLERESFWKNAFDTRNPLRGYNHN